MGRRDRRASIRALAAFSMKPLMQVGTLKWSPDAPQSSS
jgi:hypothetical protein